MHSLTLQQLFGVNAKQDDQSLVIQKSDLPHLISSANNRAEQLLVSILLLAWNEFEGTLVDETSVTVVDELENEIGYDQRELYEKLNIWFWRRQFIEGKILDTFIMDVFVNPSVTFKVASVANQL